MMSLGGDVSLAKNSLITGEVSLSNFDANRFSNIDNASNQGYAYKIGLEHNAEKQSRSKDPSIVLNYEHLNNDFQILNPYRNAEFNRDWNITNLPRTAEKLANAQFRIGNGRNLDVKIPKQFTVIRRG